jgi:hypothetical protein
MNGPRIANLTMKFVVVGAVVAAGVLTGGLVTGIALGAAITVAVFGAGANCRR